MKKILFLLSLVGWLVACGGAPLNANYPYEKEPDPRNSEFVIGVADMLRIRVWKNPELDTDIRVRPDGTITMPLVGDVRAVGLTPSQLKQVITEKLSRYIKDQAAVVTVAVTEVRSYSVTVTGNVVRPGVYTANHYLTVADAMALAGGPNRFADPSHVVLVRRSPKTHKIRRIPIDYASIAKGEAQRQNLVLLAGDTLIVP